MMTCELVRGFRKKKYFLIPLKVLQAMPETTETLSEGSTCYT